MEAGNYLVRVKQERNGVVTNAAYGITKQEMESTPDTLLATIAETLDRALLAQRGYVLPDRVWTGRPIEPGRHIVLPEDNDG